MFVCLLSVEYLGDPMANFCKKFSLVVIHCRIAVFLLNSLRHLSSCTDIPIFDLFNQTSRRAVAVMTSTIHWRKVCKRLGVARIILMLMICSQYKMKNMLTHQHLFHSLLNHSTLAKFYHPTSKALMWF